MRADVAKRRRTEKRIYHGVNKDVAVGMGLQPVALRNDNTAENKGLPALEEMRIISKADAH